MLRPQPSASSLDPLNLAGWKNWLARATTSVPSRLASSIVPTRTMDGSISYPIPRVTRPLVSIRIAHELGHLHPRSSSLPPHRTMAGTSQDFWLPAFEREANCSRPLLCRVTTSPTTSCGLLRSLHTHRLLELALCLFIPPFATARDVQLNFHPCGVIVPTVHGLKYCVLSDELKRCGYWSIPAIPPDSVTGRFHRAQGSMRRSGVTGCEVWFPNAPVGDLWEDACDLDSNGRTLTLLSLLRPSPRCP